MIQAHNQIIFMDPILKSFKTSDKLEDHICSYRLLRIQGYCCKRDRWKPQHLENVPLGIKSQANLCGNTEGIPNMNL